MSLKQKAVDGISKVKTYWKTPPAKRYMPFKEIAAYSGGGIGAYMIITMGSACLLATNSTLLSSTLGVDPMDMYIMYVLAVIANIPLTGIRANIIDNTRNKAGKYRPYIVSMAIPAAIICNILVWFPYAKLSDWLGDGMIFGETKAYVAKCAIIMFLNLLLHFFYYFFYDAYENLIHVLSPNSQERTDVASIKSVVYSFAPTVVNLFTPIIASNIFHSNTTDIRVYRFLYPLLTVGGLLLCMVVYKHTEEKIVQARTHVVQIKFIDALKAVAKNKYFWIISLAGWIGFLESAYANVMFWIYNYGGACSGNIYSLVITVYGNASLWGMLFAPFCIRKWGKKAVLVVTNLFNILFILMLLPATKEIDNLTIWLVLGCLYLNAFMGSFAHILNPSIQADIRDYQQYKTGERIDGMFAVVTTIGTVITLLTSSVLPFIYEKNGLTKENAALVTSNPEVLDRVLGDGKTVGQILSEQLANGQDNYNNALSALYDPDILLNLIKVLILVAAVGALMNVVPYIWYDFNERKQKSVIRVLKVRAMFEDFGNGVLKDAELVEVIDIIRNAKEMAVASPKVLDKKSYKSIKDKEERKTAKKAFLADKEFNDEIEIGKFVCEELDKFSTPAVQLQVRENEKVYAAGLDALLNADISLINQEIAIAKAMPKTTKEEKEIRKTAIEIAKSKKASYKAVKKYFSKGQEFKQPDFAVLDKFFNAEDDCDVKLKELYLGKREAKKAKDSSKVAEITAEIKNVEAERADARKFSKEEMDKHAYFNRAAKVYLDAEKLIKQKDNYSHFEEIEKMYDDAKARIEA
ncbi:MAG: MFS transporter [Acutalibacteraceae bacterium]|nr:MFS transporter [Acutalibacteraceae bacterium]